MSQHHHHPEGNHVEDLVDAWTGWQHDDADHNHRASYVLPDGSRFQKHHHHHPVTRLPISHVHKVLPGEGDHRHTTDGGQSSAANHQHPAP